MSTPNMPEVNWKPENLSQQPRGAFSISDVVSSFTYALDLTEGQPPGHCLRSCRIGMAIGQEMGLDQKTLWNLYYSILLKDAGCSSNAARLFELYASDDRQTKNDFKKVDTDSLFQVARFVFSHTALGHPLREKIDRILNLVRNGEELATEMFMARCERGAHIALEMGFNEDIAHAIRCLDEHWNGKGRPRALEGRDIPLLSRIALLSQVADVFSYGESPEQAVYELKKRKSSWFDPEVVEAFGNVSQKSELWEPLPPEELSDHVRSLEPSEYSLPANDERLDALSRAFGKIIDAKSPYTYGHSQRVGEYTMSIAKELGFSEDRCRWVRRGGFLHDLGKLGVSNTILDKPGRLSPEEYDIVQNHARYTEEILVRIGPFKTLSFVAGAHHERLDGKGYPRKLLAKEIPLETRIISVSDIYDALTEDRPYRKAMEDEKAFSILHDLRDSALDGKCVDLLMELKRQNRLLPKDYGGPH